MSISERDRQSLREARAFAAAEEAAERERVEKPIREATEELNKLHRKIFKIVRDRLLHSVDENELGENQCYVSPVIAGLDMPFADAVEFISEQYRRFMAEEASWYHDSLANRQAVLGYLGRNGFNASDDGTRLALIDAATLKAAALRLNEYNILEPRPNDGYERDETGAIIIPREEPYQSTDPNAPKYVNLGRNRPPAPIMHEGYDLETGEKRSYSEFEVRRMDSETYKRCFRLYKSALVLPNSGPRGNAR
jgi:hypothetical protein